MNIENVTPLSYYRYKEDVVFMPMRQLFARDQNDAYMKVVQISFKQVMYV